MNIVRPSIKILFLLLFWTLAFRAVHASGVDSIRVVVTPVQCYGLRNGAIRVDSVFGGQKPYYYSIDGQTYTTNPLFDRLWAGEYMLHVRDASGGERNWSLQVKEPAELVVKLLASDTTVVAGAPLQLRALSSVEPEFLSEIVWRPPFLFQNHDTLRQTVQISETTQFAVILRDHNGCTADYDLTVEVEKTPLYFPNVIQPGSAADAYFTVFSGEGVKRVVSLQVFSRNGALIFEQTDFPPNAPLLGWGGRWDGRFAQPGVYPWLAVIEFLDGKVQRFDGMVTLVN